MVYLSATHYGGYYDTGSIRALDGQTGAVKWSFSTDRFWYSSPSLANGVVYFGGTDLRVYALNATTGSLKWTSTTGGRVRIGACNSQRRGLRRV